MNRPENLLAPNMTSVMSLTSFKRLRKEWLKTNLVLQKNSRNPPAYVLYKVDMNIK